MGGHSRPSPFHGLCYFFGRWIRIREVIGVLQFPVRLTGQRRCTSFGQHFCHLCGEDTDNLIKLICLGGCQRDTDLALVKCLYSTTTVRTQINIETFFGIGTCCYVCTVILYSQLTYRINHIAIRIRQVETRIL